MSVRLAPLAGVRVVELGKMISAPYCGRLLADMGATVMKVESPSGDDTRRGRPRYNDVAATYRLLNRNKQSVVIDLKSPKGSADFHQLLAHSDVLIENLRPGALSRLGFDTQDLRSVYPKLIIASISGFGNSGPWADRAAYDIVVQAMSGFMSVTGPDKGEPTRVGVSIGDVLPATMGAFAVLAAYIRRSREGVGALIDLSMFDTLISCLESVGMRALHSKERFRPTGSHHVISAPYGVFRTATSDVVIAAANNQLFTKLSELLCRPDWLADPRFANDANRGLNQLELRREIEAVTSGMSAEELMARLTAGGVPCGPILDPREALESAHAQARGLTPMESDGFRTIGMGFQIDGFSLEVRPAPFLGEHS